MRIAESELIINADGSAFHIHIKPEELADTVIVFGDPDRVKMFKPLFDDIEAEGRSREFAFATGTYKGKRITALSHGIGCDNIDIVMTELDALANIDFKTREVGIFEYMNMSFHPRNRLIEDWRMNIFP